MKIDDEYNNKLKEKYRSELFETDDIDIKDIDSLISDEDLKAIIGINNAEMCELVNKKELNEELIQKLFSWNKLHRYTFSK